MRLPRTEQQRQRRGTNDKATDEGRSTAHQAAFSCEGLKRNHAGLEYNAALPIGVSKGYRTIAWSGVSGKSIGRRILAMSHSRKSLSLVSGLDQIGAITEAECRVPMIPHSDAMSLAVNIPPLLPACFRCDTLDPNLRTRSAEDSRVFPRSLSAVPSPAFVVPVSSFRCSLLASLSARSDRRRRASGRGGRVGSCRRVGAWVAGGGGGREECGCGSDRIDELRVAAPPTADRVRPPRIKSSATAATSDEPAVDELGPMRHTATTTTTAITRI